MFWFFVVIILILWAAVFRFKRRRLYELAALIPSSSCEIPIIGVTHKLIGNSQDILSTLQYISYESINNNGVLKSWFNHFLYVLVVNPCEIEVLLKSCLEKDDLHRFLRNIIGYGGIFAPVSIWRRRRKILIPAFKPKNIEDFVSVFSEQSDVLVKNLDAYVGIGSFSVWAILSAFTLDSICETAMGVKINAQSNPNTSFLTSLNHVLNIVCQRIFYIWLQPEWIFKLFPQYPQYLKCRNILHSFTDEVIQKKRVELEKEKHKTEEEEDKCSDLKNNNMKSFLDLLITLSGGDKGYTDLELREEILTLAIAATDTSAVAIGNTLKLLAKYPKVQDKVYEEIFEVFGRSDRAVVKGDLLKLKYLEMVVKESLRLFPPVPFIIRKIDAETHLTSGTILPAGCGAVISIWGTHRDPKYWGPDAEHFDPERFLPERFELIQACSYLPFSNGPRNCLGFQYALMSIKTALTNILRTYTIVGEEETGPIPHIPVKLEIMMKAVDGYQIALEKRK